MAQAQDISGNPENFLERHVTFPDGSVFERLDPITDLRKDPGEGRIVYNCRRVSGNPTNSESHCNGELVLKIKAQWPGPQNLIHAGPSKFTQDELKALELFASRNTQQAPHLVTWKKTTQPHDGIHPGGYLIYTVMTKLPGIALWDLGYYTITAEEREEIKGKFMTKLQEIRMLGIQPYDCALRNILWDRESRAVGILDFEHYEEGSETVKDELIEFQRWGLVSRPPPRTWFQEWGLKGI